MRDITNDIKNAIEKTEFWRQEFSFATEKIQKKGYGISFWVEENWATISSGNESIGYIWKKHPLVIILNQHLADFQSLLIEHESLVYLSAESLTQQAFVIQYEKLKDYIGYGLSEESFSAEDLWFLTNT